MEIPNEAIGMANGDYLIAGTSSSQVGLYPGLGIDVAINGNNTDIFLARFSESGELLWWTFFGGSNNEWVTTLFEDNQGHIWMAGGTTGQVPTSQNAIRPNYSNSGSSDGYIARFSSEGNWLDGTLLGGSEADQISSMRVDDTGRIFVTGLTNSPGLATINSFDDQLDTENAGFVAILESISSIESFSYFEGSHPLYGNFGWGSKASIINELFETVFYCFSNSDSGIVYGNTQFNEPFINNPSIVVKLSDNGEPIWGSYFFGTSKAFGAISAGDNGTILYGVAESTEILGSLGTNQANVLGSNDAMISLWNNEGEMVWTTYFGTTYFGGEFESPENIRVFDFVDGRILFSGVVRTVDNVSTNDSWMSDFPPNYSTVTVFGWFNLNGQLEYCSYFEDPVVSSGLSNILVHDQEMLLVASTIGELSFAPSTATNQDHQGFADIYLLKFDLSTNVAETNEMRAIQAYPNPAREEVVFSGVNMVGAQVEVFDMQGKSCLRQITNSNLNVSSLSSGVYLAKVHTTNGEVGSCRLVIE